MSLSLARLARLPSHGSPYTDSSGQSGMALAQLRTGPPLLARGKGMLPLPCVMVTSLIYLVVPTMPCYPASHSRDEIFYCPTLGDALCPPLWYPNFVLVSAPEPYGPFRVLGLERCACIQHSSVHGNNSPFEWASVAWSPPKPAFPVMSSEASEVRPIGSDRQRRKK